MIPAAFSHTLYEFASTAVFWNPASSGYELKVRGLPVLYFYGLGSRYAVFQDREKKQPLLDFQRHLRNERKFLGLTLSADVEYAITAEGRLVGTARSAKTGASYEIRDANNAYLFDVKRTSWFSVEYFAVRNGKKLATLGPPSLDRGILGITPAGQANGDPRLYFMLLVLYHQLDVKNND